MTNADPLLGAILDGRFQILEKIGHGGMGGVYRAWQLNIGRNVAVKVLSAIYLQNPRAIQRFETEARIISRLRHPNTLKLIDFGKLEDGCPYLVTEFLVGAPLDRYVGRGPIDPTWILSIARQVCDALVEAHEEHVIHRDLKPGNIFLERVGGEDVVRVLDFGIAKLERSASTSLSGIVCGTPSYMSPEQASGEPVDGRSDLYSLGVILFEALTGRLPFISEQSAALLIKQIEEPPPSLSEVAPELVLHPEVEGLVMSLLEKDPSRRPASARSVRDHLDGILGHHAWPSLPLPGPAAEAGAPRLDLRGPSLGEEERAGRQGRRRAVGAATTVRTPRRLRRAGRRPSLRAVGFALLGAALLVAGGAFALSPGEDAFVIPEASEKVIARRPPEPPAIPLSPRDRRAGEPALAPDAEAQPAAGGERRGPGAGLQTSPASAADEGPPPIPERPRATEALEEPRRGPAGKLVGLAEE